MKAVLVYLMCSGQPTFKGDAVYFNKDVQCLSTVGKIYKTMAECKKEEIQTTRDVNVEEQTVRVRQVRSSVGCIEIGTKVVSEKKYKMVEVK